MASAFPQKWPELIWTTSSRLDSILLDRPALQGSSAREAPLTSCIPRGQVSTYAKAWRISLGKPVCYLNDANAGALWGHYSIFGANSRETSISIVIGTGNGGGVIVDGNMVKGRNGFGGELGHVLIPYHSIAGTEGIKPHCNCGRVGDLESLCSLTAIERNILPYFLPRYADHELAKIDIHQAAKLVRGMADNGDALCREVFRVQAHALGLFFDEMVNTFDPDALIVGGGAIETSKPFQKWFIQEIRAGMPTQREEQENLPIYIMPNGDTAGARGAAIEALKLARQGRLA